MKHKLSDIFKTDNIESKRRILNRFELTKEDKADIINMSGKSNGGGSGTSKIHYYRFDTDAAIQELKNLGADDEYIIMLSSVFCQYSNAYIYSSDGADGIYYRGYTPFIQSMDMVYNVEALLVDEDIYTGNYPYITKGDLGTKLDYALKSGSEEEVNMVKPAFDIFLKYITEITEDEFFGMCDLPIAPLPE